MGDDEKVDAEQRIEAHKFAAELERAAHDMSYMAPSYLGSQGLLLPEPKTIYPALAMSKIEGDEEQDPSERQRMEAAGEYRRRQQRLHLQRREGKGEYTDELDDGEQEKEEEEENRLSKHCKT
jgi:hypothetical protein